MRRTAIVAILSVLFALGVEPSRLEATEPERPELALPDLEGRLQSLERLRGHVVVINFWATWCTPCREELPMLARTHRRYADAGVAFVGVSVDRDSARSAILALAEQSGVDYPIWIGADLADMEKFGLGAVIPATAILRSDGTVARRFSGTVDEAELHRHLDRLLDRDEPAPKPVPRPERRQRKPLRGGQIAAVAANDSDA